MTVVRRYEPAPPPPPPDEDYWAALLIHAEEELSELNSEDIDWGEVADVQSLIAREYSDTHQHAVWKAAEVAFREDHTVKLAVIGFNRGGLLVEWDSLRGFVPASQLVNTVHETHTQQFLTKYIGRSLDLRVIEIDRLQNRLILSQRAAQVLPGTRAAILQELIPQTTVTGTITNICDFGAFVDLGGVEGLIHISELSWGRVEHPSEILESGAQVTAHIMHIDRDEGRIALSIKRLLPDPWSSVENRYEAGQIVEGVVTSVVDFGAFVCLEEGLEGLIHISELAEGHFLHPRNVVQNGHCVKVQVLNIDSDARRIGLSLRRVNQGS